MSNFPILDLVVGLIFIYFLLGVVSSSLFELVSAKLKFRSIDLKAWIVRTFSKTLPPSRREFKLRDLPGNLKDWFVKAFGKPPADAVSPPIPQIASDLLNHPLLNALSARDEATSYTKAKNFSAALVDLILTDQQKVTRTIDDIEDAIKKTNLLPQGIKHVFLYYIQNTKEAATALVNTKVTQLEHFSKQIEDWFDSSMQRVTGVYKRRAMWFTLGYAIIISIGLNIDSISITKYLYNNPEARQKLAEASYSAAQDSSYNKWLKQVEAEKAALAKDTMNASSKDSTDNLKAHLDSLTNIIKARKKDMNRAIATVGSFIPLGWSNDEYIFFIKTHGGKTTFWLFVFFVLTKIFGFAITTLAICLGAPFWFDVLGKIANIRNSIKPMTSNEDQQKKS